MTTERSTRTLLQMLLGAVASSVLVVLSVWGVVSYRASLETEAASQSEAFSVATSFLHKSENAKVTFGSIVSITLRRGHLHAWVGGERIAVYTIDVVGASDRGEVKVEVEDQGHGWQVVNALVFMSDRHIVTLYERGRSGQY